MSIHLIIFVLYFYFLTFDLHFNIDFAYCGNFSVYEIGGIQKLCFHLTCHFLATLNCFCELIIKRKHVIFIICYVLFQVCHHITRLLVTLVSFLDLLPQFSHFWLIIILWLFNCVIHIDYSCHQSKPWSYLSLIRLKFILKSGKLLS